MFRPQRLEAWSKSGLRETHMYPPKDFVRGIRSPVRILVRVPLNEKTHNTSTRTCCVHCCPTILLVHNKGMIRSDYLFRTGQTGVDTPQVITKYYIIHWHDQFSTLLLLLL